MIFADYKAGDALKLQFDVLKGHTVAQIDADIDITLQLSGKNLLRICVVDVSKEANVWRYNIVVTHRLVELVARFFFALARCLPDVGGVAIANPLPSGVPQTWSPVEGNLEVILNQIDGELELDEDRFVLFENCLRAAWDVLLLHEFAHITQGHLRFKAEQEELFKSDPAFSRACEADADDRAAIWFMKKVVVNPPPWLLGSGPQVLACEYPPEFGALIASCLYLVLRIQPDSLRDDGQNYLPLEMRHMLFVMTMINQRKWPDLEAKNMAILHAMTDPMKIIHIVGGRKPPETPILLMDLGFDEQVKRYAELVEEHERLKTCWIDLAFPSRKLDPINVDEFLKAINALHFEETYRINPIKSIKYHIGPMVD